MGNLSGGGQATLAPEELGDVSNLQTWVLSSCNVLIAYDYNNNVVGLPGRTGPDDPLGVRQAQGHRWWQKLNRGGTVLLGYNYPVYSDRASLALVEFRRLVNDPGFSVPNVAISSQNKQQWAWMVANAKVGGEAWNACAWDSEFYYYLPKYDRMKDPFLDESSRVQDPRYSLFGILRVALDERGLPLAEPQAIQLPPDSPSSHPGAVQQFKIP